MKELFCLGIVSILHNISNNFSKIISCSIIAWLLSTVVYLLGGYDIALQSVIVAVILDYLTGVTRAFILKELSSEIGFKGIVKKVAIFFIIMLAVLIDRVTGDTGAIRTLVIYYFVANEGLSIIENLGQSGVPIPKALRDALKNLKKGTNKK